MEANTFSINRKIILSLRPNDDKTRKKWNILKRRSSSFRVLRFTKHFRNQYLIQNEFQNIYAHRINSSLDWERSKMFGSLAHTLLLAIKYSQVVPQSATFFIATHENLCCMAVTARWHCFLRAREELEDSESIFPREGWGRKRVGVEWALENFKGGHGLGWEFSLRCFEAKLSA